MFRDDLHDSVKEFQVYSRPKSFRDRIVNRLGPAGERPPYTAITLGLAMLGVYVFTPAPIPLQTAEILREGHSPAAPWVQPSTDDLLAGRACIPIERLLENRPMAVEHTYSKEVVCQKKVG